MKILVVIFEENISKKYKISKKIQKKNRWKGNRSKLKKRKKKEKGKGSTRKEKTCNNIYSEIVMVKKIIYVWYICNV